MDEKSPRDSAAPMDSPIHGQHLPAAGRRVEDRLLALCCRDALDEPRRGLLAAVVAASPDWDYILRKGTYHRLLGLVHHHLRESHLETRVPDAVRSRLRQVADGDAESRRRQVLALRTSSAALAAAGVDYLLLKGPSLQDLYPEGVSRPAGDLDLLIRDHAFAQARRALEDCGLRLATAVPPQMGASEAVRFAQYFEQLRFTDGAGSEVELHFRLYNYGVPDRREETWDRLASWPVDGDRHPGPAPEELFLYLTTHVNLHAFGRILWYYDVATFYRRWRGRLDWDRLAARARHRGLAPCLYHSLRWILELLWPEWDPVELETLRPPAPASAVYSWLWRRRQVMAMESYVRPFDAARFYLLSPARLTNKVRYLARVLAPPSGWIAAHLGRRPGPWLLPAYLRKRRRERRDWGRITRKDALLAPPAGPPHR